MLGLLGNSNVYEHRPSNSWRVRAVKTGATRGDSRGPEGGWGSLRRKQRGVQTIRAGMPL